MFNLNVFVFLVSAKLSWFSSLLKSWTFSYHFHRFVPSHQSFSIQIQTLTFLFLIFFFFSFWSACRNCSMSPASPTSVPTWIMSKINEVLLKWKFFYFDPLFFLTLPFSFDPQTGLLTGTNDGTLVNFFLRQFGRMSEKSLCIYLLFFQVISMIRSLKWEFSSCQSW